MAGKLSLTWGMHADVVRSNHAIAGELFTGSNTRGVPPSAADTLLAQIWEEHVTGRKMAKRREKVRNALLHNYDTATNLASKVTIDNSLEYPHYWPAKSYQKNQQIPKIYRRIVEPRERTVTDDQC